jgi:outer membrane receptor protein involved in Fe transport
MIRLGRSCAQHALWCVLVVAAWLNPRAAGAQSSCASSARGASATSASSWDGALARRVSLHGRDISLREALDRLSATAHVRLSYTAEELPLSRSVCLTYESAAVGDILIDLLDGTSVHPVGAGSDQVVLAPNPATITTASAAPTVSMMRAVSVLNRVVVTGSAAGGSQRSLPIALDVISGQQISQRGAGSLSTVLDGKVPGLWLWEQSPLNLLARYGSIRGASSFGVSYPKVYVDGIEVANSLLVTMLDPEAISRIEVIRGPQGAALYGADAISGVMNIVTRQEGTEGGAPRLQLTSAGGASSSQFGAGSVLAQNHSLSFRTGDGVRSARFGATVNTLGAFIPDAYSRQVAANGGVRFVAARSVISGTFRLFAQNAQTPSSPLLAGFTSALPSADSVDRQSVVQYTVGTTATFRPGDRWTHSVVAGFDGYKLKSGTVLDGAFPSASDSALRAAQGNAIRGTVRASTVGQFGDPDVASATVTLAAETSFMRDHTDTAAPFAYYRPGEDHTAHYEGYRSVWVNQVGGAPGSPGPTTSIVDTRSNTGLIAQTNASWQDRFFINTGLRLERNTGLTGIGEWETLPMIGAAFVRSLGIGTVKFRSAYGKGIRPPQTSSRAGTLMGLNRSPFSPDLTAEKQSGIETGADLFVGTAATFHQRASGLIQPVSIAPPPMFGDTTRPRRIVYELQNVGEITNRGWELEGQITAREFSLGATYSTVSSRVEKLATGYSGDLRVGDRMLEVPARTMGVSASVTQKRWSTSWSLSRASDWTNYDRIALASAFQNQAHTLGEFWGAQLRTYWRKYDGVTRLGGNFAYNLGRGLSFNLHGENLLDNQTGEPDNITVVPGRTITGGLRVNF